MLVETHVHTHYSRGGGKIYYDAVSSPAEMVAAAAAKGIRALPITDHNTMEAVKEAKTAAKKHGIITIPGEEVSSVHGHIVALGISEAIRPGMSAEETIDRIRSQGGIAIAAHPFDIARCGIGLRAQFCDAMEIFNATNIDRIANRRSYTWARKHNIVGVAASDAHHKNLIGFGVVEVSDNFESVDNILKAIKHGKFAIHASYAPLGDTILWNVIRMQMSYDYTMQYILNNYTGTKKYLSKWLLQTARFSPGKVDHLHKFLACIGIGTAMIYSALCGNKRTEQ